MRLRCIHRAIFNRLNVRLAQKNFAWIRPDSRRLAFYIRQPFNKV